MGFQSIIQSDFRLVLPTLESESVDGCFTDPPFNINLTPQRKTHGKIANDALTPEEFAGLLHDAFGRCIDFSNQSCGLDMLQLAVP
jgi:DNA modification methylase